jgi:hypothetical protein
VREAEVARLAAILDQYPSDPQFEDNQTLSKIGDDHRRDRSYTTPGDATVVLGGGVDTIQGEMSWLAICGGAEGICSSVRNLKNRPILVKNSTSQNLYQAERQC